MERIENNNTYSEEIEIKYQKTENDEIESEDTSSELITTPFSPNDIKLSSPPMNLGDLIDMIQHNWINFGTEYQREANLWDNRKQSRLIESILLGLRLPAFYFEEVSTRKWNIIDGLQRCSAINNFCVDKTLTLSDLEFLGDNFNNKNYTELPFETVRDIRMLPITVNLLSAGVPDNVKYILFKRLNTGGVELTSQEIRNAMFQGVAIDTVKRMALNVDFLIATEKRIPTKRKQDQDFVSRFIAFYILNYKNYKPDLERFINEGMETLRDKMNSEEIAKMEADFTKAMQLAVIIFSNDAFRKRDDAQGGRKPLNKAYFEVISTTFATLSDTDTTKLIEQKELFKSNLITIMNNKSYSGSMSGGTGMKNSVTKRFGWFRDVLKRSIDGVKIKVTDDNKIENYEL